MAHGGRAALSPGRSLGALLIDLAKRWTGPFLVTIGDQALFSAANLVLQVVVARRSTPAEYGAFAIGFAAFLFLAGFHNALLLEPMSVLGARRQDDLDTYLARVAGLHLALTIPLGAVFACVLLVPGFHRAALAGPVLGLAIAVPLVLLFWLARAACYLKGRPGVALSASASYSVCLLAGLALRIVLAPERSLRTTDAFLLMAAAGAVSVIVVWVRLGLRPAPRLDLGTLMREHWAYGRFILAASAAHGVSSLAVAPLLGLLSGLAQSGAYRALQNLTTPFQQVLAAATLIALPNLARRQALDEPEGFRRSAALLTRANMLAATAYAAALVVLGSWALRVLYGTSVYAQLGWALWPLAVTLLLTTLAQVLGVIVRAARRPDAVMWSKAAGAVSVVVLGGLLIRAFGLAGALYALLASSLAEAAVLLAAYRSGAAKTPISSGSSTRP